MKTDDGSPRRVRDSSGVWIPPPLIYIGLLILGFVIQFYWPLQIVGLDHFIIVRAAGAVLILVGALVIASAIGTFRSAGTSMVPVRPTTALAFSGPYRFTRNPMYLGMLVVSAGIGLAADAVWPILMLPIMVVAVNYAVIRREEKYLAAKFGEPYTTYTSRVRRWI